MAARRLYIDTDLSNDIGGCSGRGAESLNEGVTHRKTRQQGERISSVRRFLPRSSSSSNSKRRQHFSPEAAPPAARIRQECWIGVNLNAACSRWTLLPSTCAAMRVKPESGLTRRISKCAITVAPGADASGLAPDQLIGFDAPCSARPPAFLCQVRHAATIESILLGLVECLKHAAIRHGGVSAGTASHDEGQALLALCRVGSLCLAPGRRAQTQTDKTGSKKESNSYCLIFLRPEPYASEAARTATQ
jgi:hypothetical protein